MTDTPEIIKLKTEIATLNEQLHPVDMGDEYQLLHNLITLNILECSDKRILDKALSLLNEKVALLRMGKENIMYPIAKRNLNEKLIALCREASSKVNRY